MVVVSVSLAAWLGVVWWQDKRTQRIYDARPDPEVKLDGEKQTAETVEEKGFEKDEKPKSG